MLLAALLAAAPLFAIGPAAHAADAPTVRINEVESNGGTPGDWIELTNTGPAAVDLSGWIVKDSDDPAMFRAYLDKYPEGHFKELAVACLARMTRSRSQAAG